MNTQSSLDTSLLDPSEVRKHNTADNCWIVLHQKVYDVSTFLDEHPGGAAVILKYAGADATAAYDEVHAPTIVERGLSKECLMGRIEDIISPPSAPEFGKPAPGRKTEGPSKPHLHSLISLHDFEEVARKFYTEKAFAFYSSAATDLIAHQQNAEINRQIMLRPKVLRNVKEVGLSRRILGCESSAPFFVSPTAMARLAHPEGELAVARGCGNEEIIHMISNNASYPLADIVQAGQADQPFFFQLYVNSAREKTAALLKEACDLGVQAVFVTVDAPIPGKREADERISAANMSSAISGAVATNDKKGGGLGRVMAQYIDSTLNWDDIAWLRRKCGTMKLCLKGIQTAADAIKAAGYGIDGILLSNHGGRSLDTTQSSLLTLLELHATCPAIFGRMEIFVDGGFTRGTDIMKALCLGATAVGIGRPYLYSLSYGQEGVEHLTSILKDELTSTLKLSGITDVDQAHPGMVNTARVDHLVRRTDQHPWITWTPTQVKSKL